MSNSKKILVADDSLTIQKVIRLALSNEGYDIQTVSDGNEALETISLFRPAVVLVDISLPKVSAFEILETANEDGTHQRTKFILMSSSYDEIDEDKANRCHFDGRLTKPFDPAHLRSVIQEALNARENTAEIPIIQSPPVPPPFKINEIAEDVSKPIQDQETNTGIEIETESTQPQLSADLWEQNSPPPIPKDSPKNLSPSETSEQPESDIKTLTQETINMAGIEPFDWAVEEHALKMDVTKEIPNGETVTRPTVVGDKTLVNLHTKEPDLSPLSNQDVIDSTFDFEDDQTEALAPTSEERIELDSTSLGGLTPNFSEEPQFGVKEEEPKSIPLTQAQIQGIIQEQLESTVAKMAKDLLPGIAEKIIKKEISKLLSNPPN